MAEHRYHHGDLHAALLKESAQMLQQEGIDGLSLRKLAERVGVSRMAPYHHFADKHALLCALATEGFHQLNTLMDDQGPIEQNLEIQLKDFVRAYIRFASDNPEQYELMFGRTLWKSAQPTDELRAVAHDSFRRYAERLGNLLQQARLPRGSRPLRLVQASWAMLHGLCRLLIDGIYVDRGDMEEISEEAVRLMMVTLGEKS